MINNNEVSSIIFYNTWMDLLKILESNNIIYTLSKNKKNIIKNITHEGLYVITDLNKDDIQLIKKQWIRDCFNILYKNKKITLKDILKTSHQKASIIFAILAKLKYVNVIRDKNQIILEYKEQFPFVYDKIFRLSKKLSDISKEIEVLSEDEKEFVFQIAEELGKCKIIKDIVS